MLKKLNLCVLGLYISLIAQAQLPTYLPQNGLVAWYPFNGNANDESGNGNNGQVQNGATLSSDRFNAENSAYNFDGVDDHIALPEQFNNGQTLPEFTISAWFYKIGQSDGIIWGKSGFWKEVVLYTNSQDQVSFFYAYPEPQTYHGIQAIPYNLNNWNHIVIKQVNSQFYSYLNGVLVHVGPSNNLTNWGQDNGGCSTGQNFIGLGRYCQVFNYQPFNGKIDDLGFWNRGLSDSEISNLYISNSSPCTTNSNTLNITITQGESYSFNGQSLTSAGTYTATLQNAAGCDSVITLNLEVLPLVDPISCEIQTSDSEICVGSIVQINVNPPCIGSNNGNPYWELLIPLSEMPAVGFNAKPFSYDRANQVLYSAFSDGSTNKLFKFDLSSNSVSELPASGWFGRLDECTYDHENNRILATRSGRDRVYSIPASGGTWTLIGEGSLDNESYGGMLFWNSFTNRPSIFGGYGFFQVKNWIWENTNSGWINTRSNLSDCQPAKRGGGSLQASNQNYSKYFLFSGQGSCDGNQFASSCSLGSPWQTDVGQYCWLRDLWELDLNTYQFTNILPANNQTIVREGSLSFDYESNTFYTIGGYVPTGSYGVIGSPTMDVARMRRNVDDGFLLIPVEGNAPPISTNYSLSIFDELNNRIIYARADGIWALNLSGNCDASYSWSTGETTPSISVSPSETTTYSVTVTQGNQTCTSEVTINVNQPSAVSETVSACNSYTWNGNTYTQSGNYTWTGTNAAGCDSVVTLNLTITPQPEQPQLACWQSANFNTTTCSWDITGTQPTEPSNLACWQSANFNATTCSWDVIGTPAPAIVTNASACVGYTWEANGETYSASGQYSFNSNCQDYTLNLIINQPSSETINANITEGESYSFNGQSLTTAGTYTAAFQNAAGCDSTVTLNLSVVPAPPAGCYAATVVDFSQGLNSVGLPVEPARSHAIFALGAPEAVLDGIVNFVSLGFGGSITLAFEAPVANGAGADIRIDEATWGINPCNRYPETADVFASQDGINFVYLGRGCQDMSLDLGPLSWAQYIRITDVSDILSFRAGSDGYDVNGIECLNGTASITGDDGLVACSLQEVVSYTPGNRKNGTPVITSRRNPTNALGTPQNNNTINFVSLGFGGTLVAKFDYVVFNQPGNDLRITETSFGNPNCTNYPEKARISMSLDNLNWVELGEICLDGEVDLGTLPYAQYIKIQDASPLSSTRFSGTADGFDIDAVVVLNNGCVNTASRSAEFDNISTADETPVMEAYPNPMAEETSIRFGNVQAETDIRIELFDASGRLVLSQNARIDAEQNVVIIPTSNIAKGMYHLVVNTGDESFRERLVK